jgi:hypothetical protein
MGDVYVRASRWQRRPRLPQIQNEAILRPLVGDMLAHAAILRSLETVQREDKDEIEAVETGAVGDRERVGDRFASAMRTGASWSSSRRTGRPPTGASSGCAWSAHASVRRGPRRSDERIGSPGRGRTRPLERVYLAIGITVDARNFAPPGLLPG